MFNSIAHRYDFTNTVLSAGLHFQWRRALARALPKGESILDVATGTGALVPYLAPKYDKITAVDFSQGMLDRHLENSKTSFLLADALDLPFPDESFDAATVAFGVRNFSDFKLGLSEIRRVLKPGGTLLILEFGQPAQPAFRWVYNQYSRLVLPVLGRILTGNRQAYQYLPETAAQFPCGEDFCELLHSLTFKKPLYRALTGGITYLYQAQK